MKVYLLQDIEDLGHKGEVKDVSLGYAKNFLLVRGLARPATFQLIAQVTENQKKAELIQEKKKEEAQKIASQLKKVSLTIPLKFAKEGKEAYAGANKVKILSALEKKGFSFKGEQIELKNPLKEIGDYVITINIYPKVTVPLKIKITSASKK